ncbi:hypothetical protein QK290_09120 [Pseudarthrobacter sp. AL07]|uniref:hypothetical protein n=1 Tax=unclassified Pseudarthrobacter TaxID=2647000 RepID=UPI00249B6A4F|nr:MULTISPECIES: hypothetical protein [unclassified Pseudarthrobacter]MDI3194597.1 hypothetical protein [Pseudarthrobacter sp. AL20]MDI3208664.1 hypothetical protein [Pseudarthrobacter sp. AL07]
MLLKAHRLLERLGQAGTPFKYLGGEYVGLDIASTTSKTEGGTNAQLRAHWAWERNTRNGRSNGSTTCTANNRRRPPKLIETHHHHHPSKTETAAPTEPAPVRSTTSPGSAPTKASGTGKAGQDGHDMPGIYTRFVL